jgi:hypothetical protein
MLPFGLASEMSARIAVLVYPPPLPSLALSSSIHHQQHNQCQQQQEGRRTSIFGVPLKGHFEANQRKIPHILEQCVEDFAKKGNELQGEQLGRKREEEGYM